MLKMVDGTGIIGVDMVCPLGGAVSPPQPPNFDKVEMEGVGSLMLPNSLKAPLERVELLGNSVQGENPAPDNPQEIKSAGRKSKNLFNAEALIVGQVQTDGTINEKATTYRTVILDVPEDGKYRITYDSNSDYSMLYFTELYVNGTYSHPYVKAFAGNSNILLTLAKGKNIVSFSTHKESERINFTKDYNIMIAAESASLVYEPYGYLLDVKVTGKNLFPYSNDFSNWKKYVNNSYFGSVTSDESGIKAEALKPYAKIVSPTFKLKPNTEYTISAMIDTKDKSMSLGVRIFKNLNVSDYLKQIVFARRKSTNNPQKVSATFITDDLKDTNEVYLQLDCSWGDSILPTIVTFYDIQLELGNNATTYEPYTEQSMQIALDEPLRGIGDYKDVLTKDGVVRKIYPPYEINLNDLRDGGYSRTNTVMFSVKVQNKTVGYASLKPSILCNIFPDCGLQTRNIYNDDKECIAVGGTIVLFRVNKSRLKDISSFEATKQSFIELMVDKKMIVEYALETPVTEPLPESVQQQLQALHSENGVTHVFVDSGEVPCGIKLTYRKEK